MGEIIWVLSVGLILTVIVSMGSALYTKTTIADKITHNTKCFEQTHDKKCWDLK